MAVCSIEGCEGIYYGHGWCNRHYQRWRVHGDPLGGGTPWGSGLQFIAEVALFHEGDECLKWPYGGGKGYGAVQLDGRKQFANRIVCEAVNGPPPTPTHEAAHTCGNGRNGCVAPEHIRWATHAENMRDAVDHGTSPKGERHGQAKLTDDDVREIRRLNETGISGRKIAQRFGVSRWSVQDILSGRNWGWLDG